MKPKRVADRLTYPFDRPAKPLAPIPFARPVMPLGRLPLDSQIVTAPPNLSFRKCMDYSSL